MLNNIYSFNFMNVNRPFYIDNKLITNYLNLQLFYIKHKNNAQIRLPFLE